MLGRVFKTTEHPPIMNTEGEQHMNPIPGNPHYDLAGESIRASWEGNAELHLHNAQVEATLALAFEQHIANLIALADFYVNDGHREHGLPILKEIHTRLELNGEQA